MENTTLLLIAVIGLYGIFKAVTATIDFVFKIVAGLLILSFLGYSVLDWDHINSMPITVQDNISMTEIPNQPALNDTAAIPGTPSMDAADASKQDLPPAST